MIGGHLCINLLMSICLVFKLVMYIDFDLIHYPDLVLCLTVLLKINKTDKSKCSIKPCVNNVNLLLLVITTAFFIRTIITTYHKHMNHTI